MAWTTPRTWVAGELVTAALGNAHWRDNLSALRSGGIAIGSQGANEIIFASSSSQLSRSASFTYDGTAFLCATGSITAAASEANNTVGAGVTAVVRVANTNVGAAGRLAEIHFGISATGKYAAISGSLTDASNNTAGGIKFSTRQATTDANLTQRGQITATGLWSWETAGTHVFTGASATSNRLDVINTTSGATAVSTLRVTGGTTFCGIDAYSQGYTTGTVDIQASVLIQAAGAGGMSFYTTAGVMRFFPAGTTERGRIYASGGFWWGATLADPGANNFGVGGTATINGTAYIGDTANAGVTLGLTINQGGADDAIIELKSSDVAHGITGLTETDTYGSFRKYYAGQGGLRITGVAAASLGVTTIGINIEGVATDDSSTRSTAADGRIVLTALDTSGANTAAPGADTNIVVIRSGSNARFIFDSDGDSHQDVGTAWTNFDDFDDVALLTALSVGVSREGDPVRESFAALLEENRPALERARVVTFNEDGHHFVNMSRLQMLTVGAVRQLARALAETRAELKQLKEAA